MNNMNGLTEAILANAQVNSQVGNTSSSHPSAVTSNPGLGSAGFGGGGLASSPNVPAPGSSIDPTTGLPHTAGLTRAELEAKKALSATGSSGLGGSLNVPVAGSTIDPATGIPHTSGLTAAEIEAFKAKGQGLLEHNDVSDLSGRQQAAAQLVGAGVPRSPVSPTTARPGSIVDDIEKNVTRLGQKAYEAVPASVKDLFAEPKGKGVEGSAVKARRGSAAALFDNVRTQATRLSTDIAHTVHNAIIYDPDAPAHPAVAADSAVHAPTTSNIVGAPAATGPLSGLKDASVTPIAQQTHLNEPTLPAGRRGSLFDTVKNQATSIATTVQNAIIYDPNAPPQTAAAANSAITAPTTTNLTGAPAATGPVSGLKDASVTPVAHLNEPTVTGRRGSIFDTVKSQATNLANTVHNAIIYDPDAPSTATATTLKSNIAPTSTSLAGLPAATGPASGLKDSSVPPANANLSEPTVGAGRRGSLFENIQHQAQKLAQDAQVQVKHLAQQAENTLNNRDASHKSVGTTGVAGSEGGVLNQVKDFIKETFEPPAGGASGGAAQRYAFGTVPVLVSGTAVAPIAPVSSVSAPVAPEENQGPRPGEVLASSGSGLGSSSTNETAKDHHSGLGAAAAGLGAGVLAGSAIGSSHSSEPARSIETAPTSAGLPDLEATTAQFNKSYNLAPALPDTVLGLGAAHGATDIKATPGVAAETSTTTPLTPATADISHSNTPAAEESNLSALRQPNDRTNSLTSVTAIRHGHAGDRSHVSEPSPLAAAPLTEVDSGESNGLKSTTKGTGPNHTTSLSPGSESLGVGHPETRNTEGTSRTPGTYPVVDHAKDALHGSSNTTSASTPASASTSTATPSSVAQRDETTKSAALPAPVPVTSTPTKATAAPMTTPQKTAVGSSHAASPSPGGSTKKVGFMKKLKGEIKVISGKLSHDESKIELGEKIKHGQA